MQQKRGERHNSLHANAAKKNKPRNTMAKANGMYVSESKILRFPKAAVLCPGCFALESQSVEVQG